MSFDEWRQETDYESEVKIKGFEYVRSDVSQVTKNTQEILFELLLNNDVDVAEERFYKYLEELITDIMADEYDMSDLGRVFGIGQPVIEYGSPSRTPQPAYRGAKFANKCIYGTNAIDEGDRPLMYYVKEGCTGQSLRSTYKADTAEGGRYVDAISVLEWNDMPDDVTIDKPKMVRKTVLTPITQIIEVVGWDINEIEKMLERATPAEWYREDGQAGLDASKFM